MQVAGTFSLKMDANQYVSRFADQASLSECTVFMNLH